MNPARAPRVRRSAGRLLHVDAESGSITSGPTLELPQLLAPGDLLVFNDAATLPAALDGYVVADASPLEVRLLAQHSDGSWRAVLFGAGTWTTPTELRKAPPRLGPGAQLRLGAPGSDHGLVAHIEAVLPESSRLVRLRFEHDGAAFWSALYRSGRPVQYSYLSGDLALWDVQTLYAGRPWAAEAPSAGHAFDAALLGELRRRGVAMAVLTHGAGLSSTGEPALDAALPLEERTWIPDQTMEAVAAAKRTGQRVIAVGTSVVRALEGRALAGQGRLAAGESTTTLRIGPGYRRRVVDGLFTGVHEVGESHYALLTAFAPRALLAEALERARSLGYQGHEFGDHCLITGARA